MMLARAQKDKVYNYMPFVMVCINFMSYLLLFFATEWYNKYFMVIEHYAQGSFALILCFWLKQSDTYIFKRSLLCLSTLWLLNLFIIVYMMWYSDYELNIYVKIALGFISLCFLGIATHALCLRKQ